MTSKHSTHRFSCSPLANDAGYAALYSNDSDAAAASSQDLQAIDRNRSVSSRSLSAMLFPRDHRPRVAASVISVEQLGEPNEPWASISMANDGSFSSMASTSSSSVSSRASQTLQIIDDVLDIVDDDDDFLFSNEESSQRKQIERSSTTPQLLGSMRGWNSGYSDSQSDRYLQQ